LAALRVALIGIVCLMIAEIMLTLRRTGLPTVVVLVDDSASMGMVDQYDDSKLRALVDSRIQSAGLTEKSRLNLAKSVLLDKRTHVLADIDRRYKLKLYFVSIAARAQRGSLDELRKDIADLQPTGETTRLGAGVRSVLADLRGTPPAAIVLLTDGITTEGESLGEAAGYARHKGVPLFSIGLGSEQPVRDLELHDLLVDEVVFVDDVVNFEFKLTGNGLAGRSVEVTLREKSDPSILAKMKVTVGADGQPQKLRLPYRPTKVGQFEYVVEVEHLREETHEDNNRQQRAVSVRKEHIRVLLAQAYPNFEFRYLKNMLQRDSTIELKTVLQDADVEYVSQDETALAVFPVKRDELFDYDVIIFGDVNPALLSPTGMANISDFVTEKGGGIAFIAGTQFTPLAYRNTPLAPLFPLDLASTGTPEMGDSQTEGYRVQPTDLGQLSPQMQLGDSPEETMQIWRNLPEMYWLLEVPGLKPAARILAEHPTRLSAEGHKLPVFCVQYVGAGKVLFHATDETWRWRYRVGDVFFARYWVQTIRYLSRSKLLGKDRLADLAADRREYRRGENVRLRARFVDERAAPADDDGVMIVLEHSGQKNQQVKLQRSATSRGIFEGVVSGSLKAPTMLGSRRPAWRAKLPPRISWWLPHPVSSSACRWTRRSWRGRRNQLAAASIGSRRPTNCSAICRRDTRFPSNRCRR
jgi:hypothetical protein